MAINFIIIIIITITIIIFINIIIVIIIIIIVIIIILFFLKKAKNTLIAFRQVCGLGVYNLQPCKLSTHP